MTHPMDSVPMPEPAGAMDEDAGPCFFEGRLIGNKIQSVDAYSEEQLRAYGLSAYEMGRNAGLEEQALSFEREADKTNEPITKAILLGMAAAFRKDKQ